MILSQIQATIYRRTGLGSSPEAAVITRILEFINEAHKEILSDPVLTKLRRKTVSFSTVADQPLAALPRAVSRIYSIVDRTNQRELDDWLTTGQFRRADPGQSFTTATPEGYAVSDYASPVAKQPSDSSQLLAKSSDAADTTQTAYIEVIDSDGELKTHSVTLTGTTAVNLGPADSVTVVDFYISAAAAGEVTLHEDTGAGTELAKIGIGKTRGRYTLVEIYPIPSTAVTLHADVDIVVSDLANAADEPLVPDEFVEAVIQGTLEREWDKREKPALAKKAEGRRREIVAKLKHRMHHVGQHSGSPQGEIRRSQLGPYYPPGS